MTAMELDKNSTIEELEATLEKMVGKLTGDNVEIVQKYANCVDAGYEDHETDAWNMLIYYPSPLSFFIFIFIYTACQQSQLDFQRLTVCNSKGIMIGPFNQTHRIR